MICFSSSIHRQRGNLPLIVLLFSAISIVILTGFVLWADTNLKEVFRNADQAQAFAIAEAGIEYYRWHLAHNKQDFQDGTGGPGPYAHNYFNKSGVKIGQFILEITPPPVGSTVVGIKSTGQVEDDSSVVKIIEVKMAVSSFAKYAAVVNANVRFGAGTEVFGQVHTNGGIRFDGLAHNIVTSALSQYDDPDHSGANEFGVHTHVSPVDPLPPPPVPARPDVFISGRQFPIPAVDFTGITQALSEIKAQAQSAGFYRGPSGSGGYDVVLKTNDTFDLYRVTALTSPPSGCRNALSQSGWGTWSIKTENLLGNYSLPVNGLIFLEDNVWMRGQVSTARLTLASGKFPENPSTHTSITVNSNLLYSNYDGQDVLALLAQKNINIGLVSANILRVDAALMAQNGRVGRYYYSSSCGSNYKRDTITSYGMLASNERYGFAYTDGTGYQTRNLVYDANLLYGPPPSFPLTADNYQQIFWSEIR